jgi:hypothetical protein
VTPVTRWNDEHTAFEVWKYYGEVGGGDKDTMIKIVTWLLGFSSAIIGVYATDKLTDGLAKSLLLMVGMSVSLLAAFTALLYGAYAARNWAIADHIAKNYEWTEQSPSYVPISESEVHWASKYPLSLATPCQNGLAPVFWVFFVASLISTAVHVVLLSR